MKTIGAKKEPEKNLIAAHCETRGWKRKKIFASRLEKWRRRENAQRYFKFKVISRDERKMKCRIKNCTFHHFAVGAM